MLSVIILSKNEAIHIERAIASVREVADYIQVVDSGSTDNTRDLARAAGAEVLENPWINYATQFNWAIDQLPEATTWVLRLDADEYLTLDLQQEVMTKLLGLGDEIDGVFVPRRMHFLRRPMRWGGIFPVKVLRFFRYGRGRCENRWMDEHILVSGPAEKFEYELIDDNLNSISWWTDKHNAYASREVIDLLNLEYRFLPLETVADLKGAQQAGVKRWIKENIYAHLPIGMRAFTYFIYRYFLRFGFLDGPEGAMFHVLQGFWYRYLVDVKVFEVRRFMKKNRVSAPDAIQMVLNIDVTKGQLR
jgi:glycosyltransferase involved in cell wall biosynthesis